jgi:hypothetical protein
MSAYGEEGPPSTPISATGPSDASWDLSGLDTTVPDASQRNIVRKRVYRTVAGFSTAEFFLVHDDPISLPYDIPLASATYSDVAASDVVSRNTILESEQWFPPSADISNAIAMPTGFFIGWSGRDVYFTESFRPHAWPPTYDLSTEYEIVGGGVFGQSAGLVTTGNPYIATGTSAAGTTLAKTSTVEPGLSPHGIVTMPYGVLYPSQNGLIQLTLNGAELITRGIITKNEWVNDYSPTTLVAAQYQAAYIAFYSRDNGFMLDPTEQMATFSELDRFGNVDNVQTDPYTGDVFLIRAGKIYEWDAVDQPRVPYQWRSRDFILPRPNNFGAITIKSEGSDSFLVVDADALSAAAAWNQARFDAGPLDFLGMNAIGDVFVFPMTTELTEYKAQNQQPIGGSPLIDVASWVRPVRLTVYADNQVVFSELWQGQRCIRLPSGFKSDTWAVQLEASETVFSVGIAETCKGLADV